MSIAIWPHRIHTYGVPLQDLLEGKEDMIDLLSEITVNEGKWVYVLPSLKKAQVLSVSKQIPKNCRFSSYKQLKRHWKNNYGYRLPEEEYEIPFYVTVSFGNKRPVLGSNGWSGLVYAYPSLCICQCPPVILGCTNQAQPLKIFLEDLSNRMPRVCDQPFVGNKVELAYAVPKLHYANESNFHDKPSMMKLNLNDLMSPSDILRGSKPFAVGEQRAFIQSSFQSAEMMESKSWGRPALRESSESTAIKGKSADVANNAESSTKALSEETGKKELKRYVPVFKSKLKFNTQVKHIRSKADRSLLNSVSRSTSKGPQNVQKQGNLKAKKKEFEPTKSMENKILTNNENVQVKTEGMNQPLKLVSTELLFNKKKSKEKNLHKNDLAQTSLALEQKILQPVPSSVTNILQPKSNVLNKSMDLSNKKDSYSTADKRLFGNQAWNKGFTKQENLVSNFMLDCSTVKQSGIKPTQCLPSKPIDIRSAAASSESLLKVNNTYESMDTIKIKKLTPRNRPIIQEHLDVEDLAKGGMLYKANITTIISWLRDKGVGCRVKDKKSNLIRLVEDYLGLPHLSQINVSQSNGNNPGQ